MKAGSMSKLVCLAVAADVEGLCTVVAAGR